MPSKPAAIPANDPDAPSIWTIDWSPSQTLDASAVHEMLRAEIRACHRETRARKVTVSLRLLARGCRITADLSRLRAVYRRIIQSAIAATPFGGHMTLRSSCPNDASLRIEVESRCPWLRAAHPLVAASTHA